VIILREGGGRKGKSLQNVQPEKKTFFNTLDDEVTCNELRK
jgi:hypothetical protein